MNTITNYIREHLYEICGLYNKQNIDECVKEQCKWSASFMKLMIHRIVFGRYRYGRKDKVIKINYDYIRSIKDRLRKYNEKGNLEYLVDIANLCMLEFELGNHPNKHFKSTDDEIHVEEKED